MKKIILLLLTFLSAMLLAVGCDCGGNVSELQKLSINARGVLSWEAVADATEYQITVSDGKSSLNENKLDLLEVITEAGQYTISVKAYVGKKVVKAGEFSFTAVKLTTPTKPVVETDAETHAVRFVWQGDANTRSYLHSINDGKWITNTEGFFDITATGDYAISVKAKGYASGNVLYLESDMSEKSDEFSFLQGPVLGIESINVIRWSSETEFESFNLWANGTKIKENVVSDDAGYNLITGDNPAITETGEYRLQIEAIKDGKSYFSNMLEDVGTSNINENELYSFDNRVAKFTTVKNGVSISSEQFHGNHGYSLRLEFTAGEQLNLIKYAYQGFQNDIDFRNIKKISYWVYVPSILGYEGDTFPADGLPGWKWEKKWTNIKDGERIPTYKQVRFNATEGIPFDTWTKIEIDNLESPYSDVFILSILKPITENYVIYIDDIRYEELYTEESVSGAEFVVEYNTAAAKAGSWQGFNSTAIDFGAENANRTFDVTMEVCGTATAGVGTETVGLFFNVEPDADPTDYLRSYIDSAKISSLDIWNKVKVKVKTDAEGKAYVTGMFWGTLPEGITRSAYKIYIKNIQEVDLNIDGIAIPECGDNGNNSDKFYQNVVGLTTDLSIGTAVTVEMDVYITGDFNKYSGIYWVDSVYANNLWHDATKIMTTEEIIAGEGVWTTISFTAKVRNFASLGIFADVDTSAYGNAVYIVSRQKTADAFHFDNVKIKALEIEGEPIPESGYNGEGFYQNVMGLSTQFAEGTLVTVEMTVYITGTFDEYSGIYWVDSVYENNLWHDATKIMTAEEIAAGKGVWTTISFIAAVRNFASLGIFADIDTSAYGNAVYIVSRQKTADAFNYKSYTINELNIGGTSMPACGENGAGFYQNITGLTTDLPVGTVVTVDLDAYITGTFDEYSGIYWVDSVYENNLWHDAPKIMAGNDAATAKWTWTHLTFTATVRDFASLGIFTDVDTSAYGNAVYLVSRQKTDYALNYKNVVITEVYRTLVSGGANTTGNGFYQSMTGLSTDLDVGTVVTVDMDVEVTGTFDEWSNIYWVDTVYVNAGGAINGKTNITSTIVTGDGGWHHITFTATVRNLSELRYNNVQYNTADTSAFGNAVYIITQNKSAAAFNYKNVVITDNLYKTMTSGGAKNPANGFYQSMTGLSTDLDVGTVVTVDMDVYVTGSFNQYSNIYCVDEVYTTEGGERKTSTNITSVIVTGDSGWHHVTFTATVRNFPVLRLNTAYTVTDTSVFGNAVYLLTENNSVNAFNYKNVTISALVEA